MMQVDLIHNRRAFTLIELMIVLVVLGLLTSLAGWSLRGVMDRYQLSRATETMQAGDARARRLARQSRESFEAVVRRSNNEIIVRRNLDQPQVDSFRFRLPGNVEVGQMRLRRKTLVGSDVTIPFADSGVSPTYAVELRRGNMTRWIVVLGISGQVIPVDSEDQADALLSL